MLNWYFKLKARLYQRWYERRLAEAPIDEREDVVKKLREVSDIYPRSLLICLALTSALFAGAGLYQAIDAWQSAKWYNFAMLAGGGLFFAACAIGWWLKWRARSKV
jgi:hypothetical protein